jgi:endonuclease YncB( thermonuclease family)
MNDERSKRLEQLYIEFMRAQKAEQERRDVHKVLRKPLSGKITGTVTQVLDGDTVVITRENGERVHVRFAEIDAPEIPHPGTGGQRYGSEASSYVAGEVFGKRVSVNVTGSSFGRVTGSLIYAGRNLGMDLVRRGYAVPYYQYIEGSKIQEYQRLEEQARKEKAGVWSGTYQSSALYRHSRGLYGGADSFTAKLGMQTASQYGLGTTVGKTAIVPVTQAPVSQTYQFRPAAQGPVARRPAAYQIQSSEYRAVSPSVENLYKGTKLSAFQRIGEGLLFTSMGGAASAMLDEYQRGGKIGNIVNRGVSTYARDAYYGLASAVTGVQQRTGQRGEFSYVFEKGFGMQQRAGKLDMADVLGFAADTLLNPARIASIPGTALSLLSKAVKPAYSIMSTQIPALARLNTNIGRKFNLFYDLDKANPVVSRQLQRALMMNDYREIHNLKQSFVSMDMWQRPVYDPIHSMIVSILEGGQSSKIAAQPKRLVDIIGNRITGRRSIFAPPTKGDLGSTVLGVYDEAARLYKKWVTGYHPKFHARNISGNIMQGTGEMGIPYLRGFIDMMRDPNRKYMMDRAATGGLMEGIGGLPERVATSIERLTRTPFLYAKRRQGYRMESAVESMLRTFYNYDLRFQTPFEKNVMGRLDMWYSFHKGGKYWLNPSSSIPRRYEMFYRAQEQSQDPEAKRAPSIIPPWLREGFSMGNWKIGGSTLEDFSKMMTADPRFLASAGNPIITALSEMLTNWIPFKGKSISQDTSPGGWRALLNDSPSWIGQLLGYDGRTVNPYAKYSVEKLGARFASSYPPLANEKKTIWQRLASFASPVEYNDYTARERANIAELQRRTQNMPADPSAVSRFLDFMEAFTNPVGTAGAVVPGTGMTAEAMQKTVEIGVTKGVAKAQERQRGSTVTEDPYREKMLFTNLAAAVNKLAVNVLTTMSFGYDKTPYIGTKAAVRSSLALNEPATYQAFMKMDKASQEQLLREAGMSREQLSAAWDKQPGIIKYQGSTGFVPYSATEAWPLYARKQVFTNDPTAGAQWQKELAPYGLNTPFGGRVPLTGAMSETRSIIRNRVSDVGALWQMAADAADPMQRGAMLVMKQKMQNLERFNSGAISGVEQEWGNRNAEITEAKWGIRLAGQKGYIQDLEKYQFNMGRDWYEQGFNKMLERFQDYRSSLATIAAQILPQDSIAGVRNKYAVKAYNIAEQARRMGRPADELEAVIGPGGTITQAADVEIEEISRKIGGVMAEVLAQQAKAMPLSAEKFEMERQARLAEWESSEGRKRFRENWIVTADPDKNPELFQIEMNNRKRFMEADLRKREAIEMEVRKQYLEWLAKEAEREATDLAEIHKKQFAAVKEILDYEIQTGKKTAATGFEEQRSLLLQQGKTGAGIGLENFLKVFEEPEMRELKTSMGVTTQPRSRGDRVLSGISAAQSIVEMIASIEQGIDLAYNIPIKPGTEQKALAEGRKNLIKGLEELKAEFYKIQGGEFTSTQKLSMAKSNLERNVMGLNAQLTAGGGMLMLPTYTGAGGRVLGPIAPPQEQIPWWKRIGRTEPSLLAYQEAQWSEEAKYKVLQSAQSLTGYGEKGAVPSKFLAWLNTEGQNKSIQQISEESQKYTEEGGATGIDLDLKKQIAAEMMNIDQQIAKSHEESLLKQVNATTTAFGQMEATFESLYEATGQQAEAFWYLSKAMSIAMAIVKGTEAVISAYAAGSTMGPAVGAAYAGMAAAFVGTQVGIMMSQTFQGPQKKATGGRVSGRQGIDQVPVLATDGEWVVTEKAVNRYGEGFMSALNKGAVTMADTIVDVTPRRSRDTMHDYVANVDQQDNTTIIIENKSGVPMTMRSGAPRQNGTKMLKTMIMELQMTDPQFRQSMRGTG